MTDPVKPRLRLSFAVMGTPIPQGSKRAWLNSQTKQVMMTEASGKKHSPSTTKEHS